MIKCSSCGRAQKPCLICTECGAPTGAANLDCFAAFGLGRRLQVDIPSLEEIYHALGRKLHPDRFAGGSPSLRQASLTSTALLTRSYRTLRDPVTRGRYWLELHGEKLAENNKQMPPDLAALVFEVQEELSELRLSKNSRGLSQAVTARRAELQRAMDESRSALDRNFGQWDSSRDSDRERLTTELKSILSRIAYLGTLIRDVDRELDNAKAA